MTLVCKLHQDNKSQSRKETHEWSIRDPEILLLEVFFQLLVNEVKEADRASDHHENIESQGFWFSYKGQKKEDLNNDQSVHKLGPKVEKSRFISTIVFGVTVLTQVINPQNSAQSSCKQEES